MKKWNIKGISMQKKGILRGNLISRGSPSIGSHFCGASPPVDGYHCCQIAEKSAKKFKYSGRKKLFTARNWSGTLAEIVEK
jgi:hypothetical protein